MDMKCVISLSSTSDKSEYAQLEIFSKYVQNTYKLLKRYLTRDVNSLENVFCRG